MFTSPYLFPNTNDLNRHNLCLQVPSPPIWSRAGPGGVARRHAAPHRLRTQISQRRHVPQVEDGCLFGSTQWCKFMSKNLYFAPEILRGGRGRTRVGGATKKCEISRTS